MNSPFLVCLHDASPRYTNETRTITRALEPLVGRNLSFGVVPDWDGEWSLRKHPGYCDLLAESAGELLLHGYRHRRRSGRGIVSALAERSDEMNGMNTGETQILLEQAQSEFALAFGRNATGFLPPAWQFGRLDIHLAKKTGLQFVLGYFSVRSTDGLRLPLSTFTWDCGRWRLLGYGGHAFGFMRHWSNAGIPTLAIHPRDLDRGFLPLILSLTTSLQRGGFTPTTVSNLISDRC